MALWRSSTTRGVLGSLGGLRFPRGGTTAVTTWSGGTRRLRAPMLPFSNAPLGPQSGFDGLLAAVAHWGAVVATLGGMDDPEKDPPRPLQEWDPIAGATKGILRSGWLAIRSFEIPGVRLR